MATVGIRDVTKAFGRLEVIHGVSLDIEDGEFTILVGPSGCGKSTLLRILAGLESASTGEIMIGGRVVTDLPPKARDIAMVFQNYALYPQMTVRQNLSFSLRIAKVDRRVVERSVLAAAELLGIGELLDRFPRQLSGGQRQRVAMGRAIVREPQVFLFDEPLSNLDAQLRVQMRSEIRALQRRLNATTVYVTHDQVEAMTMADKVVVLRGGRVEQIGPPLELYDRPANKFVAGFIGARGMNLVDCYVGEGNEVVLDEGTRLTVSDVPPGSKGDWITVGVRPEAVRIDEATGTMAKVLSVEPTGAETHVTVDVGGSAMVCVLYERVNLVPGDYAPISIAAANLHFFDSANGCRLE